MKKITFLLVMALVSYVIYFDITKGTLPASSPLATPPKIEIKESEKSLPYKEIHIQAGDTVLSVMEREEGQIKKPIEVIIKDFQSLNGVPAHKIQIGKTYKFPVYTKPSE